MSKFKQKVIKAVELIPYGKVASYGQIALMVGVPRAAIQVGGTLNSIEGKHELPWWRVLNNAGRITIKGSHYTAEDQKKKLEEEEGIIVSDKFELDIEKYRFRPTPEILEKLELDDEYVSKIIEKYLL